MIKKVSLENFESHKKSSYEFKKGFNLIVGENDTGKSAIIRAVRLVSGNEWNTDSLRVGETNAKVSVETDKGVVTVVRGKNNEWTVESGGKVEKFNKIGKTILPQASEVVGIKPVKIGSSNMLVNIMNQLEGHFMLSEIEGETATGSMRAQVIDELSGLNGIEDLVRDIGGDNLKYTKDVNELEAQMIDLKKELHLEPELKQEEEFINSIIEIYNTIVNYQTKIGQIKQFITKYDEIEKSIAKNEISLSKIFYPDIVLKSIEEMVAIIKVVGHASETLEEYQNALYNCNSMEEQLKAIKYPEIEVIESLMENAKQCQKMNQYIVKSAQLKKTIREYAIQIGEMPDTNIDFELHIANINKSKKATELIKKYENLNMNVDRANNNLQMIDKECKDAEHNLDHVKNEIGVCPLCESVLK